MYVLFSNLIILTFIEVSMNYSLDCYIIIKHVIRKLFHINVLLYYYYSLRKKRYLKIDMFKIFEKFMKYQYMLSYFWSHDIFLTLKNE